MMVYPILAARHAQRVDEVFLTTDAPSIAHVARHYGARVIERPPELTGPSATLEQILAHGYDAITKALGTVPDVLVVLLCNAPTVTGGLINKGVEILLKDRSLDAVMSVSQHNEYHPRYALHLDMAGLLTSPSGPCNPSQILEDAYFADALLWVLRPKRVFEGSLGTVQPNCIVNCATQRVFPLIHEGYGDVDYVWQIPAIEEWLRRQGFSEEATPYDRVETVQTTLRADWQPALARAGKSLHERRVLITTIPFGEVDRRPLKLLEAAGMNYVINPAGRTMTEGELAELIGDFDFLIAGTEPITAHVLDRASGLRLIARVGIGLDNVDLCAARQRGILVTYTPDAPAPAVAELTIGLMLSALRFIPHADRMVRHGTWNRYMGTRLAGKTVGVIGVGRVGRRVIRHLTAFGAYILANDLKPDLDFGAQYQIQWVDKATIYQAADVITLHLPLTRESRDMITHRELSLMKPHTVLINTSRGNIVRENDLVEALREHRLGGAALDVFAQEPYAGPLSTIENCILTCHMGSMSKDCRARMELEATEEVIRFVRNEPLCWLVPEEEYLLAEC
jgi:D-3-phosphoglycerate dehydrogenase